MKEIIRYFVKAEGRVQGVGFRLFVQQNANNLHISGWVTNREDGSVHMEVQGEARNLNELFTRIKQGNYLIHVTQLSLKEIDLVAGEKGFQVRR